MVSSGYGLPQFGRFLEKHPIKIANPFEKLAKPFENLPKLFGKKQKATETIFQDLLGKEEASKIPKFNKQDPFKDTKTIQKGSKVILTSFQEQDPFKQGINDNIRSKQQSTETASKSEIGVC